MNLVNSPRKLSLNSVRVWLTRYPNLWQRPLVIAAVLGLSVVAPLVLSRRELILLPAAVVAAAGGMVLLRWQQLGLIGLIAAGLLVPFIGPSGLNAAAVLVAALFGLWLLEMIVRDQQLTLPRSITTWPLLVMLVMAVLSFGMGQLPWYTFARAAPLGGQLGGLGLYFLSAAAFLLVARLTELRWLKWMVWTFLVLGAVYITGRLVPGIDWFNRTFIQGGGTGSLFWAWLTALAFSQAVFNSKLSLTNRLILGLLTGATLYVGFVLGNDWKSGWIPPVVAVTAIIGLRYWHISSIVIPFLAMPVSTAVAYLIATDEYSWGTRVDAWLIVAEITQANPILGLGFGNYRFYAPLFPIRGYAVEFNSHSQYVDIVAQTGVVGLICFLWFFAAVGWLGWKLRGQVAEGFERAYVYGALGGLVATLVAAALGDWVIPFFYNIGFRGFPASMLGWLFLGGLVILENKYRSNLQNGS